MASIAIIPNWVADRETIGPDNVLVVVGSRNEGTKGIGWFRQAFFPVSTETTDLDHCLVPDSVRTAAAFTWITPGIKLLGVIGFKSDPPPVYVLPIMLGNRS